MKLNVNKIIFIMLMMLSTILSMNSTMWIGIWMGMEINMMTFIPLISKLKDKKSSKAIMIYFLTQSIGSMIMLFFILLPKLYLYPINETLKTLIMISLLIKMGAAPFHFWFPNMMKNLMWDEAMMLMTWQKIVPIYLLGLLNPNNFLFVSIILSSIIGGIGGLNYTSLLKIMAYSSINHLSWILLMIKHQIQWLKYFIMYSMIVMMLTYLFYYNNFYYFNQIYMNSNSIIESLMLSSLMLSLGGLPPFLGFLPKWIVIQSLIEFNMMFLMMIMLLTSMLTLFYYMRLISALLLTYTSVNKYMFKSSMLKGNYIILIINCMLPIYSIMF
uniref:NADH dehydrogenase subunit 2 n=1 Tax=Pirkimerus japonicus TaxID=2869168 RepID=UPI002176AAE4|nr:NADH dehydrogenase subunit 2 [Pirkimerus japonicus]UUJ37829.1 NADH dehydrogenase subunit 2 [Pirkimerus japonicus]